jgi:hypothetical protein
MRKLIIALLAGLVAGAASLFWLLPSGNAAERATWTPPPDTIIAIEGNKYDGFGVYHFDGSSIFPPTDSEAEAECAEYDRRIDRVRCRVEVRVWYRDLAATKRALRYAHFYDPQE